MHTVVRTLRILVWFGQTLTTRYWRMFLSSFVAGLLLVLLAIRLYPTIASFTLRRSTIIGLVGSYTPTNLPLPVQNLLSAGLVGVSPSGEAVPALSERWEVSDNGKKFTFYLKSNILWHDGTQFVATDVNYNLKDVTIKATSPTTLEVSLKEPFSPLPILFSKPLFTHALNGVGPYRVDAIKLRENRITYLSLVPFKQNTGFAPLTIKFYPTQETARIAFILGEVNTLDEMTDSDPFLNWPRIAVKKTVKYNRYVGLFFNMRDDLMKERSVRQALSYAVDKPQENEILTPISSKSWGYNNKVKHYDIDLGNAKKLLGKAIPATTSAEITISTFPAYLDLAHEIAKNWESLDILKVKIKVEDRLPNQFQVLLASQEIPPDPDQYILWHSTQEQTNITHYSNPKIDKLLEDGRKEFDIQKRVQIYFDFQRNLVEDAPAVFLFHPTLYTISRN